MAKKFFKITFDPGEMGAEWFLITALRADLNRTERNLKTDGYKRLPSATFDKQVGDGKKIYKIESLTDFYFGA